VRLSFYRAYFIINTSFLPLPKTQCARRINLSSEMSEPFTHALFQFAVFNKTTSSKCNILGAKKMGRQRVLNLNCRPDEVEYSTAPPLQFCPLFTDWCTIWLYHVRGLDSSSCLLEPFVFVVLNAAVVPNQRTNTVLVTAVAVDQYLFHRSKRRIQLPTEPASQPPWLSHHARFSDYECLSDCSLPQ
jgi:hypothetical protein